MDNKVDPALHDKTVKAELNEVDAFVSHSWADDGHEKFDGLQQWAVELISKASVRSEDGGGAEVQLWLDKACINQTNIDDALAGLPVFLAGCKQLLVLAGPTYSKRLWWYDYRPSQVGLCCGAL
jgi:hypothetical protein